MNDWGDSRGATAPPRRPEHQGVRGSVSLPQVDSVGIGLRAPHVDEMIAARPDVAWLEVHAENYMGGGPAIRALE